jgi:hypothetical protein
MSFKSSLIKYAIKLTPEKLVIWIANLVMKGIAKLVEFNFDIEKRQLHVKTQLYGEIDTIDLWIENFMIIQDGDNFEFFIGQAHSDRPWLTNILAKLVGKAWKIPKIAQLQPHMSLMAELLEPPKAVEVSPTGDLPSEEVASNLLATIEES